MFLLVNPIAYTSINNRFYRLLKDQNFFHNIMYYTYLQFSYQMMSINLNFYRLLLKLLYKLDCIKKRKFYTYYG